ncbi:MAG TPA: iron-sulfur cluster-binding domain-containing protein [Chitinophagaceae bacterium]|nr:iron-sulfur cluster-binding domain-containing protein [Chitinophagaceae bacterium]
MSLYKTIKIQEIRDEASGFKSFIFADGHGIEYKSGQYLTLAHHLNHEEMRRSYSITSTPELNEPLSIGIKRMTNGFFSRLMIDYARPGDEFLTTGAGGFFVLPENIKECRQVFFLAAGSGITPVFSLIKSILHSHPSISIVLIYSNSSIESTVFRKELTKLRDENPNRLGIEWLFSNSPDLSKARLYKELLMQLLSRFSVTDQAHTLYYMCGPLSYMRMCTYVLQEAGVGQVNIKKENFITDDFDPPRALPPDTGTHGVQIHFAGETYDLEVNFPDSILAAAKKANIALPYSCETGRCGNCAARCIKGTVWLSYNEVLTDKDLASGLVLTCVGHPVGGDVEIDVSP